MSRSSRGYDYYFQGWAGASCDIPCKPCSKNGLCNEMTGACDCFDGWNGFRCLTPCEPCDHGTCQYDGTCLCDGSRRLTEGTYALRLTRDPFFLEKGEHAFEVQGLKRTRYVHPVYMHSYDVEDYIWELEYECPRRKACRAAIVRLSSSDATQRDVFSIHHPKRRRGDQGERRARGASGVPRFARHGRGEGTVHDGG